VPGEQGTGPPALGFLLPAAGSPAKTRKPFHSRRFYEPQMPCQERLECVLTRLNTRSKVRFEWVISRNCSSGVLVDTGRSGRVSGRANDWLSSKRQSKIPQQIQGGRKVYRVARLARVFFFIPRKDWAFPP
jgi:hypothetical protein